MASLSKIVYADDEPDVREIVELTLSALGGFEVHTCANGAEALELSRKTSPDLILLDVMMPVCTGPEAVTQIRKCDELKKIPVIFITAKTDAEEIASLTRQPQTAVVFKPFDPMNLTQEITAIWSNLSAH